MNMKKTVVTLEILNQLGGETIMGVTGHDVQMVLMDALYEFRINRGGGSAVAYMNEKYPIYKNGVLNLDHDYVGEARVVKTKQVERRMKIAQALHSGHVTNIEQKDLEGA